MREKDGVWLTILCELGGADLRAYEEAISGAEDIRGHNLGCARVIDAGKCGVLEGTT